MATRKIYYITESQFKALVEKKKSDQLTIGKITEEIKQHKSRLNESAMLNENIISTIKSYLAKGLMTTAVIASLLASNQVNAQQLMAAGVPKDQIEQVSGGDNGGTESQIPLEKIEDRLLRAMKRAGLDGSINNYNKLKPEQKQKILTGIQGKIKSLEDVDKYNAITIGGWQKAKNDNAIEFDQNTQTKIQVDTSSTLISVPITNGFEFNSATLKNPEETKAQIQDLLNQFSVVDSIEVVASSSTLRNTGEFENMTWKQSSQKRAESIVALINGTEFDLGGQGVNPKQVVSPEMIKINVDGENGDGTSGPKSQYETNPQVVAAYQERGIDPSFWRSASKQEPLANKEDYTQFQKVEVKVYGRIVTTNTEDVPSYRYIFLNVRQQGGKMKVENDVQKADVSKCPVKFKDVKPAKLPKGSVLQGMRR